MFNGHELGEQLTVVVRDYVARSTATVTVQIDELRQAIKAIPAGEKGDRGEKGEPGVGLAGPEGPAGAPGIAGANGKDADEGFILSAVQRAVEAIPRPVDGKDADPQVVRELVAAQSELMAQSFAGHLARRLEALSV